MTTIRKGNFKIYEVQIGDLIRLEIDIMNRSYGEPFTHKILVTELNEGETNVGTSFYVIHGIDILAGEKIRKLFEPHRMELFLEARCDPPSKK